MQLLFAKSNYPPFHNLHEAYAVILEEMDELWAEIKKKNPNKNLVRAEAIQVAAMAIRLADDLLDT